VLSHRRWGVGLGTNLDAGASWSIARLLPLLLLGVLILTAVAPVIAIRFGSDAAERGCQG
jgi:hypothetical protein